MRALVTVCWAKGVCITEEVDLSVIGEIKPEAERAAEYKGQLQEALIPVLAVIHAAQRDGLIMEFQLQPDAYGRLAIQTIAAVKRY